MPILLENGTMRQMPKLDYFESVITMIPHRREQQYAISQLLLNTAAMFC
jgi:hypothetical protein